MNRNYHILGIVAALMFGAALLGWKLLHPAPDPAAGRTVVEYRELLGTQEEPAVAYAYAGEPLPEKLAPDEVVGKRTENSYTRDLGVENRGTRDEKHIYQAIIHASPLYVERGGQWYYRKTATTTESTFFDAKPAARIAKAFSTAVAYAASFSGFATSDDGNMALSATGGSTDEINFISDCDTFGIFSTDQIGTTGIVKASCTSTGNGSCNKSLGYLPFDTSTIPAGSTVTAATLSVYVTARTDTITAGDGIFMVQAPASLFSGISGFGSTAGATSLDLGAVTTSAYNNWVFNSTGFAWITGGGTSLLGLREEHEINNSITCGAGNSMTFSTSEQTGTSQDPTLAVTYTAPRFAFWQFQDY